MMVFIYHICPDLLPFFAGGNECISFFIILSGFCLSLSEKTYECSAKGVICYSRSRIMKFYPLHIFVLICFFAINLLSIILSKYYSNLLPLTMQMLVYALLLQAFIPSDTFSFVLNGASWYLSATAFFYIIFIPIFMLIKKRIRYVYIVICVMLAIHTCIIV